MDGAAFRNLPLGWLGPVLILAAIGVLAFAAGAGVAFWYFVFSHLHWVA